MFSKVWQAGGETFRFGHVECGEIELMLSTLWVYHLVTVFVERAFDVRLIGEVRSVSHVTAEAALFQPISESSTAMKAYSNM